MSFFGSPFKAEVKNKRVEGKGIYIFPSGNTYVGDFKDGRFHGRGVIHFKTGGTYDAIWEAGMAKQGKYTFEDGLLFEAENWDYCTMEDRRFYSERVHGFPSDVPKLTDKS